jgi:hypothetical protein
LHFIKKYVIIYYKEKKKRKNLEVISMKHAYISLTHLIMIDQEKNETAEEFRLRVQEEMDNLCEIIKGATGLEISDIEIDIVGE